MLKVDVTYICKSGMRDDFYEAIVDNGIEEASLNEEGCFRYEYFVNEAHPDILFLKEEWASAEAQREHMMTDHFQRLSELKEEYIIDALIEKEEVSYVTDEKPEAIEDELVEEGEENKKKFSLVLENMHQEDIDKAIERGALKGKGVKKRYSFRTEMKDPITKTFCSLFFIFIIIMYIKANYFG